MNSRERILSAIKNCRVKYTPTKIDYNFNFAIKSDLKQEFRDTLGLIGGSYVEVEDVQRIPELVAKLFPMETNKLYAVPDLLLRSGDSGNYRNVDVAILKAEFAVAENGAIWISDRNMPDRVVPFICEHLVLIVHEADLLSTMHDAYERMGTSEYEFGTFIAGPSKTADIEQTLVLGAHGPKTLTAFMIHRLITTTIANRALL